MYIFPKLSWSLCGSNESKESPGTMLVIKLFIVCNKVSVEIDSKCLETLKHLKIIWHCCNIQLGVFIFLQTYQVTLDCRGKKTPKPNRSFSMESLTPHCSNAGQGWQSRSDTEETVFHPPMITRHGKKNLDKEVSVHGDTLTSAHLH